MSKRRKARRSLIESGIKCEPIKIKGTSIFVNKALYVKLDPNNVFQANMASVGSPASVGSCHVLVANSVLIWMCVCCVSMSCVRSLDLDVSDASLNLPHLPAIGILLSCPLQ